MYVLHGRLRPPEYTASCRRENALNRGELAASEEASSADAISSTSATREQPADKPQARSTSIFNVKPEQPQLKTEAAKPEASAKPQLPKIPAPEQSKSALPDKPK